MKINEVIKRTGLTDRTIRFYIEKGLLQTRTQLVNGRITRDFTDEEVSILTDISKLRGAGFSIQDILDMQNPDNDINLIIQKRCDALEEEQKTCAETLEELREINKRGNMSWRKFASILFQKRPAADSVSLRWPQEEILPSHENASRRFPVHLLMKVSVLVLLLCITGFFIGKYFYEQREHTCVLAASDIVFEKKWTENSTCYVTLRTTGDSNVGANEFFTSPRTLEIGSWEIYDAIQMNGKPYSSMQFCINVKYGEAKELELLGENGFLDVDKIGEKILSDFHFLETHGYVLSVTGD